MNIEGRNHFDTQDFAREADPEATLASLSLKRFATLIFRTCPGLQPYSGALDAIYKQFNDYKQARSWQFFNDSKFPTATYSS